MSELTIVWFRRDLRLTDHPALHAAAARGAVLPVYIDEPAHAWSPGAAARVWLDASLRDLETALACHGLALVIRRGAAVEVLAELVAASGATAVYWNTRYDPVGRASDAGVAQALAAHCVTRACGGQLLFPPTHVSTASGTPYRVFTPFWRACRRDPPTPPLPVPPRLVGPHAAPAGLRVDGLGLVPSQSWARTVLAHWRVGETAAHATLGHFLDTALAGYAEQRDFPAAAGVSRLAPHLAWGEISARSIWHAVVAAQAQEPALDRAAEAWLRQLAWREFAYHLLYHFPHTTDLPLREEFAAMPWREDEIAWRAWTRGRTGQPLVDAGMRELWETGYLHNRVRMVVASFLCKHLGIDWRRGARWFWDTLFDADLANNTLGWQWVAGCGADAAPYYRIFNPVTQSRRFDASGAYLRRWLPELAGLDATAIHEPPPGCADYPPPLVDLARGREAALARYAALKAR